MDHLSPLFWEVQFQGFSSATTETTCILNMALRPYFESLLIDQMKSQSFALSVNGSNDTRLKKLNHLTVRIFYIENGMVSMKFLDMCLTSGIYASTAEPIFHAMDNAFTSRNILWHQCIGLSMDNVSG